MNELKIKNVNENTNFDTVNVYGNIIPELNYKTIFRNLTEGKKLNSGTIKGSVIENELYILSDKEGMYFASSYRPILCDIKKEEIVKRDYYNCIEETIISYNCNDLKDIDQEKFIEVLNKYFNVTKEEYSKELDNYLIKDKRNTYFGLYGDSNYVKFYVQFDGECIELVLKREKKVRDYIWTSEEFYKSINVGKYELKNATSLQKAFEEFENESVQKGIGLQVTKLENGYIYNNKYYEKLDEIIELVEEK